MKERLKKVKKVELHCHLDGSVPKDLLYELLIEDKIIQPQDMEDFEKLISVGEDNKSLVDYLEKFDLPLKVMQTEENLERISYEILKDFASQNIIYAEIRFAPYLHMDKGLSFDQVVKAVTRGIKRGEKDFNIIANLILIAMRHEDPKLSMDLVENGSKFLNDKVAGVDLAGNEADFPPELHEKAYKKAKDLGYNITIHAGETGIEENIRTSVNRLYAKRIGHGIAAIKNQEIMDLLVDKNIALEMCPISNLDTKSVEDISEYPIREFIERGVIVTVNTDNTTVSDTSLEKEYRLLIEKLGLSIDDIVGMNKNSIRHSFASEKTKKELLANY